MENGSGVKINQDSAQESIFYRAEQQIIDTIFFMEINAFGNVVFKIYKIQILSK